MRVRLCVLVLALAPASAFAATSERDKAWDALIAAAKAHGGVETKLDQSSSYVFQRPDGSFMTFTQMLKGGKRAACLIAKKQDATVCINWDNGKTTYGDRKDAASPWVFRAPRPADEEEDAEKPGLLAQLLTGFGNVLVNGPNFSCCDRGGNLRFSGHK